MSGKSDVKEMYDRRAIDAMEQDLAKIKNINTNISPTMKYFRQRKVETALELGGFKKGDRILEIGCNMGQYTTLFAEKGYKMVGTDLSDKAIDAAKKSADILSFKGIEYFQSDAEDLSMFKDNTFDGVVSFSTLRYVSNIKKALKEICRVAKTGSSVALDFPNKHCPWFKALKNRFGVENHICDHFYSSKELICLFEEAGFQDIISKKIMFTHYTFTPKFLGCYKLIDLIGEKTFFIKELAAIVMCKGVKK